MKQFCALLLAGGMGAGSVVAVQQAKPAVSKPKVQKTVQRNTQTIETPECTTVAPIDGGFSQLAPMPPGGALFAQGVPGFGNRGIGGGGSGIGPAVQPDPIPLLPAVPQPDTWVMLVAGFGFMGLALRRRTGRRQQAETE